MTVLNHELYSSSKSHKFMFTKIISTYIDIKAEPGSRHITKWIPKVI